MLSPADSTGPGRVFVPLYRGWFESRYGRLPSPGATTYMRRAFSGYPRSALAARMNDGPWWIVDAWIPQCDPRIPLRDREPRRSENCRPGQAQIPWMRDVIKWHLGTALEAGTLTWSTVLQRCPGLLTFDRWLSTLDDPAALCKSLDNAGKLAASFHQWVSDPANRTRSATKPPAVLEELLPPPADPLSILPRFERLWCFAAPFSVTGQPAISLPIGQTAGGLPVGVQLVAALGREDLLLRVAAQLETAAPWSDRRPPLS